MAQLNITRNQEEILQLRSENSGECFKKLLQESLNSVLKAESAEQLQAAPYERTDGHTDSRNGFRDRETTTRIGRITLRVPRHRNQPFSFPISFSPVSLQYHFVHRFSLFIQIQNKLDDNYLLSART